VRRVTGRIILSDGDAPAEAFPGAELAELASEILRDHADVALQYGPLEGYPPLRKLVASWLVAEGVNATEDEVVIVTGAKQNLDITSRAFCRPGDRIITGAPTYMVALRIFKRNGAVVETVPNDANGLDVDALDALLTRASRTGRPLPKLIYDVPDIHNPTGAVLSEDRREKLVGLASHYGVTVLEDNPYRWTRLDGTPARPLKHFDKDGVVVSTGTFAKILGPGLRLGWVHAKREILNLIEPYKADMGTSPLCQMLAYEFYKRPGSLERHLTRIRAALRPKREAMLQALEMDFTGIASWTRPIGGYYIWLTLRDGIDTDVVATEAAAAGVTCFNGSIFFASNNPSHQNLRLCYSFESPDRIRDGVARIARIAKGQVAGVVASSR